MLTCWITVPLLVLQRPFIIATLLVIATIVIKLVSKLRKAQGVHVSHIRVELKSAGCKEQKWTKKLQMFSSTRDVCTGNVNSPHVTQITAACD